MRTNSMGYFRQKLGDNRRLALFCAMLALALRALVPAGMMLAPGVHALTVTICADASGGHASRVIVVPQGEPAPGSPHDGKADHPAAPCAYTALSMAALGGADPVLLAGALAIIVATGVAAIAPTRPRAIAHLRPPLRGPPLIA